MADQAHTWPGDEPVSGVETDMYLRRWAKSEVRHERFSHWLHQVYEELEAKDVQVRVLAVGIDVYRAIRGHGLPVDPITCRELIQHGLLGYLWGAYVVHDKTLPKNHARAYGRADDYPLKNLVDIQLEHP